MAIRARNSALQYHPSGMNFVNMLAGSVFIVFFILGFLFWLWMLVDCATSESSQGNDKIVRIVIIVFTNIIGAVVYWVFRRPQRYAELHR